MSRNRLAIVSSILFVALALLIVLIPVPYVTWRPGSTLDVLGKAESAPVIKVEGIPTYPTNGSLLMTTVSSSRADATVGLPEALYAFLDPASYVLPRANVYPAGQSNEQIREEAVAQMTDSRQDAAVAALRAAGVTVTEIPQVVSVVLSGPANGRLEPGDLIESVDTIEGLSPAEIVESVQNRGIGDPVVFRVIRDGQPITVTVVTGADNSNKPSVGVGIKTGYTYSPKLTYQVDSSVVGPSAGLVFALAIYEKITAATLVDDHIVAATGTIEANGQVHGVGGLRQKIKGAENAGADTFLLPAENCGDVMDLETDLRLVPVESLNEAIASLQLLQQPDGGEVASCERAN